MLTEVDDEWLNSQQVHLADKIRQSYSINYRKTPSKSRHNPFQSPYLYLNTYLERSRVRGSKYTPKYLLFEEGWGDEGRGLLGAGSVLWASNHRHRGCWTQLQVHRIRYIAVILPVELSASRTGLFGLVFVVKILCFCRCDRIYDILASSRRRSDHLRSPFLILC